MSVAKKFCCVGAALRGRPGLQVLGLLLVTIAVLVSFEACSGCQNVCEMAYAHIDDCRVAFCEGRETHPICSVEDRPKPSSCRGELEPVWEEISERDCDALAEQLGWTGLEGL